MLWMCACECICMLVTTVVCGCCRCCCRRRHYSALSQAQPKCDPIKLLCFVTIPPLLQCTRTREHSPRTHTRAPRKNGRLCYVTFAIVVITWNRNSSGAHQHTRTCNRIHIHQTTHTITLTRNWIIYRYANNNKNNNNNNETLKKTDLATEPHNINTVTMSLCVMVNVFGWLRRLTHTNETAPITVWVRCVKWVHT